MSDTESTSDPTESALARWPVFLAGAGFGVLAAYVLDPQNGRGRRTQMRDQGFHFGRRAFKLANRRWRNLNNRLHGLYVELTHRGTEIEPVDDRTLVQRVRSEFGHRVRFAQAIRVDVDGGVVTLSGPVLSENVARLVACVKAVPGVRDVVDQMDRHEREEHAHH